MSIEAMSFILGGLLVGIGLLGGGIEIREIKIPQVGRLPRLFSLLVGTAFVALAVVLSTHQLEKPLAANKDAVVTEQKKPSVLPTEQKKFFEPTYGDQRLDACYEWGQRCGEEAASAWCKTKGFKHAVDFPTENVGSRGIGTRLIGTQVVCKHPNCSSFAYIVCE